MKIAILEPFYGGSHKQWIDGYRAHSQHEFELYTLPDSFWKWRMDGGAIELANQYLKRDIDCDLFIGSDMLDANTFLSLVRKKAANTPYCIYFHENQLSYPWSPQERNRDWRRRYYGLMNYRSALAADRCFFNSSFHMSTFFCELERELEKSPDYNTLWCVEGLKVKSQVLPLGMSIRSILESLEERCENHREDATPLILWNHRWDYDKRPDIFFNIMRRLDEEGFEFQLAVLGEELDVNSKVFAEAKQRFDKRITYWGYVENFETYLSILSRCTLLPVTSEHDFFGASVVEAVTCGVVPLLPRKLVYPEHFQGEGYDQIFYNSSEDLLNKMREFLRTPKKTQYDYTEHFLHLDWELQAPKYDLIFEECHKERV